MNIIIRQRENKKWQAIISYKSNNKWKQKSKGGFDKRKDANLWANEASFEIKKLEKQGVLEVDYTLEELYDLFFEFKINLSHNSRKIHLTSKNFFKPFLNENINNIKSIDLLNYIKDERIKNGKKYNEHIKKLSSVFNFAIKDLKIMVNNPCAPIPLTQNEDTRIKFVDTDLYNQILNYFEKPKEKLFIRTAYETGMRASEIYGIRIQNINNLLIDVKEQYNSDLKELVKLKTKNSYRKVPISKELYKELKNLDCDISGRIFYDVSLNAIKFRIAKFNTSLHCFRHTRATILVGSGIDLTVVSNIIGDNIETILKIYTKLNKDKVEDGFEKVRQII